MSYPVAVVPSAAEASKYLNAVLKQQDLIFETGGHVIVNSRVICKYSEWFSLSRYTGLLAPPYNLLKKAIRSDATPPGSMASVMSTQQLPLLPAAPSETV